MNEWNSYFFLSLPCFLLKQGKYTFIFNVNYRTADNLFNKITLAMTNTTFIPIIEFMLGDMYVNLKTWPDSFNNTQMTPLHLTKRKCNKTHALTHKHWLKINILPTIICIWATFQWFTLTFHSKRRKDGNEKGKRTVMYLISAS